MANNSGTVYLYSVAKKGNHLECALLINAYNSMINVNIAGGYENRRIRIDLHL